jgi:multiple sugar transport system substrate-binding protein
MTALALMASWVGTISPAAVTTYHEQETLSSWQNGDSVFARNWPYMYSQSQDPTSSKIAGKVEAHTMLYGGSNTTGHSCLGGWQYGINAFSKNPDAAWKFIQYMIAEPAQKTFAVKLSLTSCLLSIYDDADVLKANPFFAKLKPVFQTAQPRPVSPFYPDISIAIQQRVHNALTKQSSPAAALSGLQSDVQAIVTK